jgi:hypothetical protein
VGRAPATPEVPGVGHIYQPQQWMSQFHPIPWIPTMFLVLPFFPFWLANIPSLVIDQQDSASIPIAFLPFLWLDPTGPKASPGCAACAACAANALIRASCSPGSEALTATPGGA